MRLGVICSGLLLVGAIVVQAELQPMDGPPGADVRELEVMQNGDVYACGTMGGWFRLPSGSAMWESVPTVGGYNMHVSTTDDGANQLAVNGHDNEVFFSSNHFINYSAIDGPEGNYGLYQVVGFDPDMFLVHADNKSVHRTVDGGNSWTQVFVDNTFAQTLNLIHGSDGKVYIMLDTGPSFVSTDNGATWTEMSDFGPAWQQRTYLFVTSNGTLLAGGNKIARSTDGGASWSDAINFLPELFRGATELSSGTIVAASNHSIYTSDDDGASWTEIDSHPFSAALRVMTIAGDGSSVYVGTKLGVYASSDQGQTWELSVEGMNGQYTDWVSADQDGSIVAGHSTNAVIFTRDTQGNWTTYNDMHSFATTAVSGDGTFYAGGGEVVGGAVISRSDDGGATWTETNSTDLNSLYNGLMGGFGNVVLASGVGPFGGLYRSDDGAETFTEVFDWWITDFIKSNQGKLIMTCDTGGFVGLWESTDNGVTWNNVFNGSQIWKIAENQAGTLYGTMLDGNQALRKSTDGGATWETIDMSDAWADVDLTFGATLAIRDLAAAGNDLYAEWEWTGMFPDNFIHEGGLIVSHDGGTTWEQALPQRAGGFHLGLNGTFYVGTGYGIYSVETGLSVDDDNSEVVRTFSLAQNYPNPFNPSTTISFSLDKPGHTIVYVYDITGREVARLLDRSAEAGVHKVLFDGTELASGVYFYTLANSQSGSLTKRMMLIK